MDNIEERLDKIEEDQIDTHNMLIDKFGCIIKLLESINEKIG